MLGRPNLHAMSLDGKVEGIPTNCSGHGQVPIIASESRAHTSRRTKQSPFCHTTTLADLELDGQPELVLTVVDTTTGDPHMLSLPLGANTPTEMWDVTLIEERTPVTQHGLNSMEELRCCCNDD